MALDWTVSFIYILEIWNTVVCMACESTHGWKCIRWWVRVGAGSGGPGLIAIHNFPFSKRVVTVHMASCPRCLPRQVHSRPLWTNIFCCFFLWAGSSWVSSIVTVILAYYPCPFSLFSFHSHFLSQVAFNRPVFKCTCPEKEVATAKALRSFWGISHG